MLVIQLSEELFPICCW